ncbi:MAG: L,D-transpeptidase family protein [Solirubrobacterales bacterium]|nr:L,D-transpeptidase family protein [Solirubrobacterales bacterium]
MRSARAATAGAVLLVLALAGPAVASTAPATERGVLSNQQDTTRWAHATSEAIVHARPDGRSRASGRLRRRTEDGRPEVYVAIRTGGTDDAWVQVELPRRPNGSRGWVPAYALGPLHLRRTVLTIDRARRTAVLKDAGRTIWRSRVGVGKASTPTPAGRFYIREGLRLRSRDGIYGPYAFGTSAYSVLSDWPGGGVIGIHGTNQPELIPGSPSHGCVRVPNDAMRRLAKRMPIGTRVVIR